MSTTWTADELNRIGGTEELQLASARPDGTLRPYVTIWVVRAGDELYVRSAYGSTNPWYRRATAAGAGRIRAGGIERDVTFTDADPRPCLLGRQRPFSSARPTSGRASPRTSCRSARRSWSPRCAA